MRTICPPPEADGRGPALEVLEQLGSDIVEGEIDAVADMLAHSLGDQHPAGFAELLQPGRDVDAVAQDVRALNDYVAEVDADPQHEAPFRRDRHLPLGGGRMHCDRAQHSVDHRPELDESAVAGGLHETAMMPGQQGVDDVPAQTHQCCGSAGFVPLD
jgi:hypothetical protein